MIVPKRKRRLDGSDQIVLSRSARALTTGEIAAHFEEIYGAKVSKETISRITEKVCVELPEWSTGPPDPISINAFGFLADDGFRLSKGVRPDARRHGQRIVRCSTSSLCAFHRSRA
jgi:hypothetical protein